jgi:hypothetical protein
MKPTKDEIRQVDEFLRKAHSARPEVELSDEWQAELMRDIGEMATRPRQPFRQDDPAAAFTKLLFRFAGAGAVFAVGLLLYAHFYGPDLDRQVAGVVLEQPASPVPLESLL